MWETWSLAVVRAILICKLARCAIWRNSLMRFE
jgi:hypothetical protein